VGNAGVGTTGTEEKTDSQIEKNGSHGGRVLPGTETWTWANRACGMNWTQQPKKNSARRETKRMWKAAPGGRRRVVAAAEILGERKIWCVGPCPGRLRPGTLLRGRGHSVEERIQSEQVKTSPRP
jgi:hypothetical protein